MEVSGEERIRGVQVIPLAGVWQKRGYNSPFHHVIKQEFLWELRVAWSDQSVCLSGLGEIFEIFITEESRLRMHCLSENV